MEPQSLEVYTVLQYSILVRLMIHNVCVVPSKGINTGLEATTKSSLESSL